MGFSTLIVTSLLFLYVHSFSALGTLIVQAAVAWLLAAFVLRRGYREVTP